MYDRPSPVPPEVAPLGSAPAAQQNASAKAKPPLPRLPVLDALRGVAAAVVVLHHARTLFSGPFQRLDQAAPLLAEVLLFISQRNVEAVWSFFVLSGFSIRLSLERRGLHEPSGLRTYFRRRARRILPLYWLALALSWAVAHYVAPVPAQAISNRTLLGNLLFLQSASGVAGQWFVPYAANGALWSLSFEAFFYLAFPALILATGSGDDLALRRRRFAYVVAASMGGHLLNLVMASPFSLFLSASLVWYAGVEIAERWLGRPAAVSRPLIGLALAVCCLLRFGCGWLELHGSVVGFLALLVGPPALSRGRGPEPVSVAVCAWLGGVSYGLYLLHVPIMRAVAARVGTTSLGLGMSVGCAVSCAWAAERVAKRLF